MTLPSKPASPLADWRFASIGGCASADILSVTGWALYPLYPKPLSDSLTNRIRLNTVLRKRHTKLMGNAFVSIFNFEPARSMPSLKQPRVSSQASSGIEYFSSAAPVAYKCN